jgi:CheY-like chemotaxis protein
LHDNQPGNLRVATCFVQLDAAFWSIVRSVAMVTGKWVLVVDDDEDLRNFVVEMLQGAGYAATAASGGAAALTMMGTGAPALVLSDLVMPKMDGHEFLVRTRQLLGPAMPPFIFATALPPELAGVTEPVLAKPYGLDQLLDVVGYHCRA